MQQPLPEGTRLHNQYRIVKRLGSGGFAITYLAIDEFLNREVAIKELFPYGLMRAGNTKSVSVPEDANQDWTPQEFERVKTAFLEEGRILAKIEHPNIVRVLAMFSGNNTHYLVMEYVVGQTLHAYSANRGPLPWEESLALIRKIAAPVAFLHQQPKPIYHRDLNPKNVLLKQLPDGTIVPVVIDFGLARVGVNRTKGTKGFAYSGYAPLEQYINLPGEEREFGAYVDVYSLSALLFRLLTKEDPTSAEGRAVGAELPSPRSLNSSVPEWLSNAVMQGMALKASERPQTVAELLKQLKPSQKPKDEVVRSQQSPHPQKGNTFPTAWIGGAGVVALIWGSVALFGGNHKPNDVSSPSATPTPLSTVAAITPSPRLPLLCSLSFLPRPPPPLRLCRPLPQ